MLPLYKNEIAFLPHSSCKSGFREVSREMFLSYLEKHGICMSTLHSKFSIFKKSLSNAMQNSSSTNTGSCLYSSTVTIQKLQKLSHTKTVTAAFHLNNRKAKRELEVYNNDRLSPFCLTPSYLGVKLDRLLTFCHHQVALHKKETILVRHTVEVACRLDMGCWWQNTTHSCLISSLLTPEYFAPVWCRSAHTRLIDNVLNDVLRKVTGCLRHTTDHLPILSGIQPAELR